MAGAYDLNNDATRVILVDASGNVIGGTGQAGNADDQAATDRGLVTNARLYGYDGAAWDRVLTGAGRLQASIMPAIGVSDGGTAGLLADASGGNRVLANAPNLYNGATWDRQRGNVEGTLLASAARTANALSPTQTNHNARGVVLFLNVTAASGTGGLTLRLWEYDPASAAPVVTYQASSPIITTGLKRYAVYPGISGTDLGNNALARTWAVFVVAGDASSYTYSVGFCTIV